MIMLNPSYKPMFTLRWNPYFAATQGHHGLDSTQKRPHRPRKKTRDEIKGSGVAYHGGSCSGWYWLCRAGLFQIRMSYSPTMTRLWIVQISPTVRSKHLDSLSQNLVRHCSRNRCVFQATSWDNAGGFPGWGFKDQLHTRLERASRQLTLHKKHTSTSAVKVVFFWNNLCLLLDLLHPFCLIFQNQSAQPRPGLIQGYLDDRADEARPREPGKVGV